MKLRLSLIIIVYSLSLTLQLSAQESKEKLYKIYVEDLSKIKEISSQGYDIYSVKPGKYIEVLTSTEKIQAIQAKNIKTEFIANSFKELLENQLGNALGQYHNYQTTYQELTQISQNYPEITRLDTIGHSVNGRVIGALKISDNPDIDEDEPLVLIAGCHHGNEVLSVEAPLYFINYLMDNYGTDSRVTNWVNSMEIWFIPLVNPDGREALQRRNMNNVDLNRNYSFQFTPGGSHGPSAFSEPETRAVRDFVISNSPVLSLTYHTSGRLILYPWDHTDTLAPDMEILSMIGGTIADSLNYTLRQGGHWYFTAGEYCDYMYGVHGVMPFTVEMYTSQTPSSDVIDQVMERNLPGFISLLSQVNKLGVTGIVTDTNLGLPIDATIEILEIGDQGLLIPRKTNSLYGRYYRYLAPAEYTMKISAQDYEPLIIPNVSISTDSLTIINTELNRLPSIVLLGYELDDDSTGNTYGNGDGFLNTNETIGFSIDLENQTDEKVNQVCAKLSSSNQYISIPVDSIFLGDLEFNVPFTSEEHFLFHISLDCPDNEVVIFNISINDSSGRQWKYQLPFKVFAPDLKIDFVKVNDNKGNKNGILNTGEEAEIEIQISNSGHQAVNSLTGLLSSTDRHISIIENSESISFLDALQNTSLFFKVKLADSAPQIHIIDFQIDINTSENVNINDSFLLNNIRGLFDNFEHKNDLWIHASMKVTTNQVDDWQWGKPQGKANDPLNAFSGTNCWGTDLGFNGHAGTAWDGLYENTSFNYLQSPSFDCSEINDVKLKFQRWLNVQAGDIAKISVNKQVVWYSPAIGINDTEWAEQIIDISEIADNNKNVVIKFDLLTNNNEVAGGWNIDDVLVANEVILDIADYSGNSLPDQFQLFDSYPNPFNASVRIKYYLPKPANVELIVYNIIGQKIKTLVNKKQADGIYYIHWNGKDENGDTVSSGLYLYKLITSDFNKTKKMVLIK